jgi:hypothetical protein
MCRIGRATEIQTVPSVRSAWIRMVRTGHQPNSPGDTELIPEAIVGHVSDPRWRGADVADYLEREVDTLLRLSPNWSETKALRP